MTRFSEDTLRADLTELISAGAGAPLYPIAFDELALRVFRFQFERNPLYRAFCERRGADPGSVGSHLDIPAVPTDAFKAADLVCGDASSAAAVFHTSGTTAGQERRGKHIFPDLALYDAALEAGFKLALLPAGERLRILALVPSRAADPESSLSYMAGRVIGSFGAEGSGFYVGAGGLDTKALIRELGRSAGEGEPVCLLATSFALLHLLEDLEAGDRRLHLPEGSRLMDTGGFKGAGREVSPGDLYERVTDFLAIQPRWCVNEYGMTEMSSQFYNAVAGRAGNPPAGQRSFRGPAWVRSVAVDPDTLSPLPAGERGLLRHLDLANLYSVAALQTHDLATCKRDGSFQLHGRAAGAEARGCSIAMDELLTITRRGAAGSGAGGA